MSVGELILRVKDQWETTKATNKLLADAVAQLIQEKQELEAKEAQV